MSQHNTPGFLGHLRDPIWQVVLALLTLLVAIMSIPGCLSRIESSFGSCHTDEKSAPTLPSSALVVEEHDVQIPAKAFWYDTAIQVQNGDWIEFTATGSWWNGVSTTSPDGDSGGICGLSRPACGGCSVPGGNLGELVGKVGDGIPFRIGSSALLAIGQGGNLLLTMNENTGACLDGRRGSCYDDNNGAVDVKVTIRRVV